MGKWGFNPYKWIVSLWLYLYLVRGSTLIVLFHSMRSMFWDPAGTWDPHGPAMVALVTVTTLIATASLHHPISIALIWCNILRVDFLSVFYRFLITLFLGRILFLEGDVQNSIAQTMQKNYSICVEVSSFLTDCFFFVLEMPGCLWQSHDA